MNVRKALPEDIDAIHGILNYYAKKELLLERTREDINSCLDNFLVAENLRIVGIVAFYEYYPELVEIRSLAVVEEFKKKGIGRILVNKMVKRILSKNKDTKIFVLSYTPEFFEKLGFHKVTRESLPEKIWKDCVKCRHMDACGETALIYGEKNADH